ISRLIEAKPEELRIYIEEAAGISKYKERRRDTENRMRRTQENLERLSDIREELERQLSRLERQAQAAEKYTEFKKQERELKAQVQALKYRELDQRAKGRQEVITELELKMESFVTEQVNKDTLIEKHRSQYTELGDKFNEVQGRFYAIGADIARIEQSIRHADERNRQLQSDLERTERESREADERLKLDQDKAELWQAELLEIEPELALINEAEAASGDLLQEAEELMHRWQIDWDAFNQRAAEPRQRAEVQQSRIQHLEQVQQRLLSRVDKLKEEKKGLGDIAEDDSIDLIQESLAESKLLSEEKQALLEGQASKLDDIRTEGQQLSEQLDQSRSRLQSMRGRHASLDALQQAALGEKSPAVSEWLESHGLSANPRLAEAVNVTDGWDKALETVLGNTLQAVCVEGTDAVASVLGDLEQGELILLDSKARVNAPSTAAHRTLASMVEASWDVAGLLAGIYIAEDLSQALTIRATLGAGQSVVTRDGLWLSAHWLKVLRETDASAGVLARRQEIEQLEADISATEQAVATLAEQQIQNREAIKQQEQERENYRRELDESNRRQSDLNAELSARQVQLEQQGMQKSRLEREIREAREQMEQENEQLAEARMILSEAIEAMEADTDAREQLLRTRDDIRGKLDNARQKARHDKDKAHELQLRESALRNQLEGVRLGISRLQEQSERLIERREQLSESLSENRDPAEESKLELEAALAKRLGVEEDLTQARRALETVEHELREAEQQRNRAEQEVQGVRSKLEQERLAAQTFEVQRSGLAEQLAADNFDLTTLLANLADDVELGPLEQELEQIAARINRLGLINLAAIDEYKTESERKRYLDAQNDDLHEALETLENAIKKIDRETRTRFKETFDQVNSGLQELFPKVFGGGHAYLELTGEDLLDTGITIMARPPGKRNSTIHLLSGGEKALTAIALVFSIFRLNPAPFCMLDEVDAPLDDANVGRYARMVEEMSQQVQFIYITHNKIAMEMAHQLMGVTMHEPGVSRLVTVDVDEAAELAAV
ncbi:MAG TPA: chromosome segregation protein SMC, partial [Cellvibrionaceae bacterium]